MVKWYYCLSNVLSNGRHVSIWWQVIKEHKGGVARWSYQVYLKSANWFKRQGHFGEWAHEHDILRLFYHTTQGK
jgi:hypothetical protein